MANEDRSKTDELVLSLQELHLGYKETKQLLGEQLQAVVLNDIELLNTLIERQGSVYDKLNQTELKFTNSLTALYKDYFPDGAQPSITGLLQVIGEPSEWIDRLRTDLYVEVHKTEQLRMRLVRLLEFASDHNTRSIEALSAVARKTFKSYKDNGRLDEGRPQGLGLNQMI